MLENKQVNTQIYLPDDKLVFDIEVEDMPFSAGSNEYQLLDDAKVNDEDIEQVKELEGMVSKDDVVDVMNALEDLAPEELEEAKKIIENIGDDNVGGIVDLLPKE